MRRKESGESKNKAGASATSEQSVVLGFTKLCSYIFLVHSKQGALSFQTKHFYLSAIY